MTTYTKTRKPGWSTAVFKSKQNPIRVPSKRWTTLLRWEKGELDLGPSVFTAELYGPPTGPRNIETRWVRLNKPGPEDDDVTKRQGHVIGTRPVWASITTTLEDIGVEDLPMELRIFQDGGGVMTLHTVVGKVGRLG